MSALALVHNETGSTIVVGEILTHPETRKAWRLEGIVMPTEHSKHTGQHMIKVSTFIRRMRVTQIFHPEVFGCVVKEIAEDVAQMGIHAYLSVRTFVVMVKDQFVVPLWLGGIAWVVLAIADHYHLAEVIFGNSNG